VVTLPHRNAYERWRAAVLPPSLAEQLELDALVYGTACARVDATGRIERVHPLLAPGQGLSVEKSRTELRAIYPEPPPNRNARKRQRLARRGK
jgi:hypothetical protein